MSTTGAYVGQQLDRFWAKVDKTQDCWTWTGCIARGGYGHFRIAGKMKYAHRVSYELTTAAIPDGMEIDHKCFNRSCVNPSHLRPLTRRENLENLTPRKGSASGIRGVYWSKRDKLWEAQMTHRGRVHWLGYFTTKEAAAEVVRQKRNELLTFNDLDRIDVEEVA